MNEWQDHPGRHCHLYLNHPGDQSTLLVSREDQVRSHYEDEGDFNG